MLITIAISVAAFQWDTLPENTPFAYLALATVMCTAILRVWSIGLLYRRAYDLYVTSLACWLGLMGIRSSDSLYPPGPLMLWFVLLAGLSLDLVQVRALRSAIVRSNSQKTIR
jgi:hypothetical protein